jgi:DNA-binding SARP family transcriptional activator
VLASDVRFRLLGAVEAWSDGRWRSVLPARSRQILALLLCSPGQVVLVDHLVAALWGDHLPETPAGLVRNYIMKLRRALHAAAPIVTRSGGYQLDIDPDTVDAVRFERCLRRARSARAAPAAPEAEKLLEEALSYWRGPALADVRQCFALECEAARLEDLRLAARQSRAELMLERASYAEAVSELRLLSTSHPDRERLCELVMVALARDGRPGEALTAYARLRDYHRSELGLDPSDRMVALQQAVLRGRVDSWDIAARR